MNTYNRPIGAIFITFSGNCKDALKFYQRCFGGRLQIETFDDLEGLSATPVISASLVSDTIIIYGSDLVHQAGRTLGNYISIFLNCKNKSHRRYLIEKLRPDDGFSTNFTHDQNLIEIIDVFDVRWILGI